MKQRRRITLALALAACLMSSTVQAVSVWEAGCGEDGVQASGALYRICLPAAEDWNGDLVIWCHGYKPFNEPIAIDDTEIGGFRVSDMLTGLGYAFATTSYSRNGLAFKEGVADVEDLTQIFIADVAAPRNIYIVGGSEGGYIATKSIEEFPDLYAGAVGVCGPIGDFPFQVNFFGDFRVMFDVFFPGLLPGDAIAIPEDLIENWGVHYETVIKPVIFAPANIPKLLQLISVAKLTFDTDNFWETVETSISDALWYNVFATNDAAEQLGGQPYDNSTRYYTGSSFDWLINVLAKRFTADPAAMNEMINGYNTSGVLEKPLVTMHTTGDQQIPYLHEVLYRWKVLFAQSASNHVNIPIERYGHCNFTAVEILIAFGLMINMASGDVLDGVENVIAQPEAQSEFIEAAEVHGLEYAMERSDAATVNGPAAANAQTE